jgi:hypothetical protein
LHISGIVEHRAAARGDGKVAETMEQIRTATTAIADREVEIVRAADCGREGGIGGHLGLGDRHNETIDRTDEGNRSVALDWR